MKENIWKSKGESIVSTFLGSKKNSNSLLDLEDLLLSSEEECVLATIPIVYDLFSKIYSTRMLNASSDTAGTEKDEYKSWLLSRYEDFTSHLLSYLSSSSTNIQIQALETLLLVVKLEGYHSFQKENAKFPFTLFKKIIDGLVSSSFKQQHVIRAFQEYTDYSDIKLYVLKSLQQLLTESDEVSEVFIENCLMLLCSVKFPKRFDESAKVFIDPPDSQQPFQLKEKVLRKFFTSVWNRFLSCELSTNFLGKLLPVFNENVLPHLQNPCLMTDFLTNAYDRGGILSLLALKGLYFLMDKYNLEYPDFYVKLYALLDQDVMNGKHSSRFFYLTDLFLSSTHLPAHIVAAFAKKFSRLSLVSSTSNVLKILNIVSNLLAGHVSLRVLIHRPDDGEANEDPFNMEAMDPAKSNAIESSLWEFQALKSHIHPEVCCRVKELLDDSPKLNRAISDIATTTSHDLYAKMRKRKFSEVPLAVHKPVKLVRSQ